LHTSDPALLAPWLIYFVVLSAFTVVENTFDFILSWVPFYSWIRFFAHLYLILPGSQGATFLYQEYVEPFLYHHEREIDDFISQSHDRAKSAGMAYVEMGIEWARLCTPETSVTQAGWADVCAELDEQVSNAFSEGKQRSIRSCEPGAQRSQRTLWG
jgi:hypothetical protein